MDLRRLVALVLFGLVTVLLWRSPWLLPFKLLVVFFHESWHALAAVATGGRVEEIGLYSDQSGVTLFRGGSFAIVASAGYVGSSLTGALLLWASARPRLAPALLGTTGGFVLLMTLLYVPLRNPFGFFFGTLAAGVLILAAVWRPRALVLLVMSLAVMCCLYSIYDFGDYLLGDAGETDAGLLARHLGLPWLAVPIGLGWSGLSLWILWRGLSAACRVEAGERRAGVGSRTVG